MQKLQKTVKWVCYIVTALVALLVIPSYFIARNQLTKSNFAYYQELEYENEYWEVKCKVVEEVNNFIYSCAPTSNLSAIMLVNLCDEFNIDVRLPLAQGLAESHYGTKGLATKTNSVWNMGAFDGKTYHQILGIYKYSHPNESIRPYLKKLKEDYLGYEKTESDLLENFVNLSGNRYASYEHYEAELKQHMTRINSETELDSLLLRYSQLKRDLNR